jgi:predicted O-methyltransferase YrrM
MYQSIAYLKFVFKSTNQHGVHSPFVYDLVTKCFYDKKGYPSYNKLALFRAALLSNKQSLNITDYGAGSRVFKSKKRAVQHIAKTSGISKKRAQLLHRLVNYLSAKHVLELGTSLGLATSALSLGHKDRKIITIEGCPETARIAKQQFDTFQLNNIDLRVHPFESEIPKLINNTFDVIYIDGNHQKEATLNYFEQLLPTTHNDSVIIFDDIHWSKDMTEAWHKIKEHPKVTVSIDTFFWGFVFFRKEQVKENFNIRV